MPLGEAESAPMSVMGAEEAGEYFGERMEAIERMVVAAWKVRVLSPPGASHLVSTAQNKFRSRRGAGRGSTRVLVQRNKTCTRMCVSFSCRDSFERH